MVAVQFDRLDRAIDAYLNIVIDVAAWGSSAAASSANRPAKLGA